MNDKRQKNQLQRALAFTEGGGVKLRGLRGKGPNRATAKRETENLAREERLMLLTMPQS